VTADNASASSFLTVWPSGQPRPTASSLNFGPGAAVANLVIAGVGANGKVAFYNDSGRVDLIVDVLGWFDNGSRAAPPGATFHAIAPSRFVDTRSGDQPAIGPSALRSFALRKGDIPNSNTVKAVIGNVAAVSTTSAGFLTTYPSDKPQPVTSTVNFTPAASRANLAYLTLSGDGRSNVFNSAGTTNVLIDIAGYFSS
jgi:hypothetical protein